MKIIDGHDVIEHAEVNGESREFIRILTDYIEDAPVVEPKIDKDALIRLIQGAVEDGEDCKRLIEMVDRPQEWIPCSERLPKDLEVVNITWINHRPMTYYADIKDKPFTATAIHYKDKWWWYSPICEDLLAEYGKSECDKMDDDIEVTAWMPLPPAYEGEDDE